MHDCWVHVALTVGADEISDYSSTDLDPSTQLYLKINFFRSGADEFFVCAYHSLA